MTRHNQALYLRVTDDDIARLDAMAERIRLLTRSGIARAALRLGLEAIEANPAVLVGEPVVKAGRKPRKRTRKRSTVKK